MARPLRLDQLFGHSGRVSRTAFSRRSRSNHCCMRAESQSRGIHCHRRSVGTRIRGERFSAVRVRSGSTAAAKRIAPRPRHSSECEHAERQNMTPRWRVGVTRDILDSRGEPAFGRAALEALEREPAIAWEYLPQVVATITPDHAARYDAIYVNAVRVPASAVAR